MHYALRILADKKDISINKFYHIQNFVSMKMTKLCNMVSVFDKFSFVNLEFGDLNHKSIFS
jgi:hypothetical protein